MTMRQNDQTSGVNNVDYQTLIFLKSIHLDDVIII